MLQKVQNIWQAFASEPVEGSDFERHWPPFSANTIKSRQRRERLNANRRDPIGFYSVPVRRSTFNNLLDKYEQTLPPEQRGQATDDKKGWRDQSAKMLAEILSTWDIRPPKRP